jgi:hypothetical protein
VTGRLQEILPPTETGMFILPALTGVPDAVKVILPLPTLSVPAGAVKVIPFTALLVNTG